MNEEALLPCPFCGGEAGQPWGDHAVCCDTKDCAAHDIQATVAQWNVRAALSEGQAPEPKEALRQAMWALAFYADPGTYHAMTIMFDPPCGEFREDFSEDHGDSFYERPMPGKLARQTLAAIAALSEGQAPEPVAPRVRYTPCPSTLDAAEYARIQAHPLFRVGDTIHVWVNEGDIYRAGERVEPAEQAPEPVAQEPYADLIACLRDWPDMCQQYSERAADVIEQLTVRAAGMDAARAKAIEECEAACTKIARELDELGESLPDAIDAIHMCEVAIRALATKGS